MSIYVRHDGDNTDGLTWAKAKTTIQGGMDAAGAGGTVWIGKTHAESSSSAITLTSPGTVGNPQRLLCVEDSGNPQPPTTLATGASVSTTGTAANVRIRVLGSFYCHGVTFSPHAAGNNSDLRFSDDTAAAWQHYNLCTFTLAGGNTTNGFLVGAAGNTRNQTLTFTGCIWTFGATGQSGIQLSGGRNRIHGGSIAATGSIPTNLFGLGGNNAGPGPVLVTGVDLSAFGSGKNVVNWANSGDHIPITVVGCTVGASVTLVTGTADGYQAIPTFVQCSSNGVTTQYQLSSYAGTETSETTIVRTGGATDGTTAFSRKMVSSANVTNVLPMESLPIERWNETTGSAITVTVSCITDNVTLKDTEAWIEVDYYGTASSTLLSRVTDRLADPFFGTAANQADDSASTWVTTGLGTPVKQKLHVTFTPQMKGLIRVRVMLAKASTTMYYDPFVQVT